MRMREVKTEANELVGDAEFEVGDAAYKMRKVSLAGCIHRKKVGG